MFRVLTEREDKKYGYYIDLNHERGKNFLYEFNENYGKGFANSNNIDDLTNNIQSLLLLFNYNGLNLTNISGLKEADLYNTLIKELELSKEQYMNYYRGNNRNIIEKVLSAIGDLKTFAKMKKYIFTGTSSNKNKSSIKITLTKGIKQTTQYLESGEPGEPEEPGEPGEPEAKKDVEGLDQKDIADLLSTYTSMLAIFSDKNNTNCSSIDECIEKTINYVSEKFDPFNCNYEGYNVFGSYIYLIKNLKPKEFVKSLELYKELIASDENKTLKNALIILFDNIREVMKEDKLIYEMSPEEIQEKIEQYLPVRDAEKNEFGEVFTPIALIEEMLDKLPKEVWKNKDYKWLDPANGIGNFPMVAYRRLMEGLKDEIKTNKKRSEHIITNMLYMFEINPKNVGVARKIFGHNANIFCDDFLKSDIEKICGVKKFDVIMGNPPYSNKFNTGDNKPYLSFTFNSLSKLNENGLLLFITPPAIYDYLLLKKKITATKNYNKILNITKINIDNKYLKLFFNNVGSEFTYFLIENSPYKKKTLILNKNSDNTYKNLEETTIKHINDTQDNPLWLNIQQKLLSNLKTLFKFEKAVFSNGKMRRVRKNTITDGIVTIKETPTHKYKLLNTYATNKDGTMTKKVIYYFDSIDKDYDKKRLIVMAGPSYLFPHILEKNTYTLSDNIFYLLCNDDNICENMLFFLTSPLGKYIDKQYRPSMTNGPILDFLNNLKTLPKKKITTNEMLYKYFNLTQKEIEEIEKNIKSGGSINNKINNITNNITNNKYKLKTMKSKHHKAKSIRNNKLQKQKYKKSRTNKTRSNKTRKIKV
jgi:hypothetical protein